MVAGAKRQVGLAVRFVMAGRITEKPDSEGAGGLQARSAPTVWGTKRA